MPGDIYEDSGVNVYDLTFLARYITSLETFTERQEEAADVNNDGLVDILDVIRLAQYLVNWSGIELMSLELYDEPITPVISVGSASVNATNEAEIPVYIKNNSGILGYRFVLDYNAEDIEVLSITPSELIDKDSFNTNFSCELYFDNSYAEQSAKAIIAFYDGDGRMVQLMPKNITVKPGKVDLSIDYDKKAYSTYKLMIWEGMGNLKPITEVK